MQSPIAAPPPDVPPQAEPGPPPRWWEETPAEAARYDRMHFDRDED
ncbi:hypothetical protein ACWCRC_38140 [Streptomyces sp. NPDC001940]